MSRPVLPKQLVKLHADLPRKSMRRLTLLSPGFRPNPTGRGIFGDPGARVINLVRQEKKRLAVAVARSRSGGTTARSDAFGTSPAAMPVFIWIWRFGGWTAGGAVP